MYISFWKTSEKAARSCRHLMLASRTARRASSAERFDVYDLFGLFQFGHGNYLIRPREDHRSAIRLKGRRSRLQDLDKFQPFATAGHRLIARVDAINKMLANRFQRLFLNDMGDIAVPVMI